MNFFKRLEIASALFLFAIGGAASAQAADLKITTLSSRPEMVSGGDTLIKVEAPDTVALNKIKVTLNGADVTRALKPGSGHFLVGLVDGLKEGSNKIDAKAGGASASLAVTNYSIKGPIFSGPHDEPFYCDTVASGWGEALDTDCSIKTKVEYYYKSTSGKIARLPDPKKYPADVASTTTSFGKTVPFVIRVESGTINRGIYQIAILDDPAKAKGDAYEPSDGWNGRLLFSFGGGSGIGHHQGTMTNNFASSGPGGADTNSLGKGYATATSGMLAYMVSGNDTLVAETTMMIKEYFSKHYGVPVFTIGSGGSGGSMLQHLMVQNYPGILDAVMTTASFPCGLDLTWVHMDPALLLHYFEGFPGGSLPELFPASAATAKVEWTEEQKVLVSGYYMKKHGLSWSDGNSSQYLQGGTNPVTAFWPGSMSGWMANIPEDVYNADSNPTGIRATHFDAQKAMFGVDPKTGFAYQAWSNVGQQYGLVALNNGKITPSQFLDLNENIGGFDKDGYFQKERTKGDDQGILNAYKTGRKFMGYGVHLPIFDLRGYSDQSSMGDTHLRYHSFQTKIRLIHANGTDANRVMWTQGMQMGGAPGGGGSKSSKPSADELGLQYIDQWLVNIANDKSNDAYAKKVIKDKPAEFVDGYFDKDDNFVADPASLDPNTPTNKLFPFNGDTVIASGSPLEEEASACALKAPQKSDYKVTFTDEEWERLNKIFKDGVCDYTKPGIHQDVKPTPWLSYGPAPQIDYKQE